ncbi:related to TRI13-cytochrome P450 [Fusarium fujikuroi IMI 58289]|uniref:Related to TRI13-cytochrome P450 n=1 Tax=Gibberella fujikuroi (strain CBS 195.34 / IMI 58289 / NRRL A-6831) TaxID=1279085 RepID=S0EK71_GIBF5|nr:related to TRI13-cytochrome P450 [Fusarium fujikuroi IMI 58289]KLP02453.1 TRI13-cytochrome P450 [Fusarium fujikuroi]CCT75189.1 related to TRI13-cytochrome P450 [Fusarium fujikuroi IMI 58289]
MLSRLIELSERAPKDFTLALGFSILSALYLLRRWLLPKPIPGIPYNKNAVKSFMGDIPEFRDAPNRREWWAQQPARHQSPIVQVFMRPFGAPWVFVADYFEASDICMRRLKEFDRSDVTWEQFNGVASAPEIHDKFSSLLKLWDRKLDLSGGRPFDIAQDIHNSALDIILSASFGIDSGDGQIGRQLEELKARTVSGGKDDLFEFEDVSIDEEQSCFTTLADSVGLSMRSPLPTIHHFLYRNLSPKMRRARAGRDRLRDREIAKSIERRESGQPQRCALDNMLAREDAIAEKEGRKPNYRSQTIMSELMGYLVAGHETTSAVLRWGMKYLTANQRVQSLLREAIGDAHTQATKGNRVPTAEEILKAHIPYLDAVIEEMLRHSRVAPVTLRQATTDTQILGRFIPKGTTVGFLGNGPGVMMPSIPVNTEKRSEAALAHMERTQLFDEQDLAQFVPERWLTTTVNGEGEEETAFDPQKRPSQAFGLGPRGCFGKKLAYIEIKIFLTLLFWTFKLEPVKPELATEDEMLALTRSPKNVYVKLAKV